MNNNYRCNYLDLSVDSRSVIGSVLRQKIDPWDTDKWRYFAITALNNCLIIRSPSLFSYVNHSLAAHVQKEICYFSHKGLVTITHEQNIICSILDPRALVFYHVTDGNKSSLLPVCHAQKRRTLGSRMNLQLNTFILRWHFFLSRWLAESPPRVCSCVIQSMTQVEKQIGRALSFDYSYQNSFRFFFII